MTSEGLPVGVEECPLALHLVIGIAALIPAAILPLHHSLSFHLVQGPLPLVFLLPKPVVLSVAMDEIIHEVPFTIAAIIEVQVSLPMFIPLLPLTLVVLLMVIHLNPYAILSIIFEFSLV